MTVEGQVNPQGDQGAQNQPDPNQSLGWRAALPDEYKEHEFVKTFQKPGDFVKTALEIKTEADALKAKLANAIIKPGEKATPEEITAYRKTLGIPDKPEQYEFDKAEGVEHSEEFLKLVKGWFHEAGIPMPAAKVLGQKWDAYMSAQVQAEQAENKKAADENEKAFRAEFKSEDEYKAGRELAKRVWEKFTQTKFDEAYKDVDAWRVPMFMKFIFQLAKATGEDLSPKSGSPTGGDAKVGMKYKSMDKFKGG